MMNKDKEELLIEYNNLNENQKLIVDNLEENILLLAPAGTGKTKTLSLRIGNIIGLDKAKGEEILCLTFTNKGCKEMIEKIQTIVGTEASNIIIKTFHSFCFYIIKTEAKNTDISSDFIIYDEEDCKELISELNNYKFNPSSLQRFIDFVKENSFIYGNVSYKEIVNNLIKYHFNKIKEICSIKNRFDYELMEYLRNYGHLIVETYNKSLWERHALDFNDLMLKVFELFKDNNVVEKWRKAFKYIHIDEVQDTSIVEYNIISKLFPGNMVLMCGDYFQTIYGWRGSKPEIILDNYIKSFNPNIIFFNENYRSTETLLNASAEFLEMAFGKEVNSIYKNRIYPKSSNKGEKLLLKSFSSLKEEGEWIFNKIKALGVEDLSKVAILTRNNRINNNLSNIFAELNSKISPNERVNFLLIDQFKFFRRQEIKDVLAYLKLIENKFDNTSLKRILKRFIGGIGERTIENIESQGFKQLGIRLTDFIDPSTHKYGEVYGLLLNELKNNNVVIFDVESTGIDILEDEIVQISGVKINCKGKVIESFERFLIPSKSVGDSKLVHGFSDEFLKENGEEKRKVLTDFLEFIDGTLLIGHNVGYDIGILNSELSRIDMEKARFIDCYDTLDIARRFYPKLDNHKLETLSNMFETEVRSSHNAMDDVLATKDILIKMVEEKINGTSLERINICGKYLDKFNCLCSDIKCLKDIIGDGCSKLSESGQIGRPCDLIEKIVELSNIKEIYKSEPKRINNVRELYLIAKELDNIRLSTKDALSEFLKTTALSNSEIDRILKKHPRIPIITIHQGKGGEFDYVFLAGLQDYVFPAYASIKNEDLSEEKRVFYVGLTRGKKEVFLTYSREGGKSESRLIQYIPEKYLKRL